MLEFLYNYPFCHHISERSHLFGVDFPLCCRCTGLYTFLILGLITNKIFKIGYNFQYKCLTILIIISLISSFEVAVEGLLFIDFGNFIRFITGSISGFGLGILLNIFIFGRRINNKDFRLLNPFFKGSDKK